MRRSFWLGKIAYNAEENAYDVGGLDIVYKQNIPGSKVDLVSCENPNKIGEPAIVYIYTDEAIFPELEAAGLKRLGDVISDIGTFTGVLTTIKLRRIARNIKEFREGLDNG